MYSAFERTSAYARVYNGGSEFQRQVAFVQLSLFLNSTSLTGSPTTLQRCSRVRPSPCWWSDDERGAGGRRRGPADDSGKCAGRRHAQCYLDDDDDDGRRCSAAWRSASQGRVRRQAACVRRSVLQTADVLQPLHRLHLVRATFWLYSLPDAVTLTLSSRNQVLKSPTISDVIVETLLF